VALARSGAFYAAMILGLIDTLSRSYLDQLLGLACLATMPKPQRRRLSAMLVYILMAAVLAFRPQGLFSAGMK
jgi:branched-chain amino acid transport system permease protein